jgi:ribosome-associated protein
MTIIEDTRQKSGMHELKHQHFEEMGVELVRNMLPFGDYALPPSISVDTKADMAEIASNIGSDHKRFKRECIAARDAGCQLIILVENTDGIACVNDVHKWVNLELIYRPRAITGDRLQKAMLTMNERYGVRFEFCRPEESAKRIMELLGVSYE